MAITKIEAIRETRKGDPATHLLRSLLYIANPDKTRQNALVGSLGCLPLAEAAYDQMIRTKKVFHKEGGRQGYHIIIAFEKGECNPDTAFKFAKKFAKEYLGDFYECVYAVHDDKEHCHIHLVFNSIDRKEGYKYRYEKGDWKKNIQPITNRLCKRYGLSIMPAEYAAEKTNLPRDVYNQQQEYRDIIKMDCEYLLSGADDVDHFIWLLRQYGYTVKEGVHIAVRLPGMRRYARIDTIDKRFSREAIAEGTRPRARIIPFGSLTSPMVYTKKHGSMTLITGYYKRLRGIRAADVHRFRYHSAFLYQQIKLFHKLQEEYLFLCDYNIGDMEELANARRDIKDKIAWIDAMQKKIYRENATMKRRCKSIENVREFQKHHLKNEEKLKDLREKKRFLKKQYAISERISPVDSKDEIAHIAEEWEEKEIEASEEELIRELPEYPPHKEKREVAEKAAREKATQEAAEKAAREKAAQGVAEKPAKEQAAREEADRVADELIAMYQGEYGDIESSNYHTVLYGAESEVFYDKTGISGSITEDDIGQTYQHYLESGQENRFLDSGEFNAFLAEQQTKRAVSGRLRRDSEEGRVHRDAVKQRSGVERGTEDKSRSIGGKVR